MRESALAALSWLRANVYKWGPEVSQEWFRTHDIHLHVPAGAIPKDGPSAGVTLATALVSLVTGRPVRSDTAMTGEITLTGQVLPIGGFKEKALAAQRAEITRVLAPRRNEADLEEVPAHLRSEVEFIFAETIDEVLDQSLEGAPRGERGKRSRKQALEPAIAAKSSNEG